jgi:hypothetical protein
MLRQVDPDIWKDERRYFSTSEYRGMLGKFDYLEAKVGRCQ